MTLYELEVAQSEPQPQSNNEYNYLVYCAYAKIKFHTYTYTLVIITMVMITDFFCFFTNLLDDICFMTRMLVHIGKKIFKMWAWSHALILSLKIRTIHLQSPIYRIWGVHGWLCLKNIFGHIFSWPQFGLATKMKGFGANLELKISVNLQNIIMKCRVQLCLILMWPGAKYRWNRCSTSPSPRVWNIMIFDHQFDFMPLL